MTSDDGSCTIPAGIKLYASCHITSMSVCTTLPLVFSSGRDCVQVCGSCHCDEGFAETISNPKEHSNLRALGIGRLQCLFQLGCGLISMGKLGRLETERMRAVRGVLHASNCDPARIPDDELRLNGIPSIATTLICRRLGYASLLSRKRPDHLFG